MTPTSLTATAKRRVQGGLSLVEILVALLIGMFLMAGMIKLYVGNKQTFRATDALSRLQENGRFAMETMTRDVRMAGYTGCPPANAVTNLLTNHASVWWEDFGTGTIVGFDGSGDFPGEASVSAGGNRIDGTDALIVLQSGGDEYEVLTHAVAANQITLDRSPTNFQPGSVVVVCDAKRTSILQLTAVSGATITFATSGATPGNSTALTYGYGPEARVLEYQPTAYYVGASASGSGRSLYRFRLQVSAATATPVADELIDQVRDLQIHYGVDADGDNLVDSAYLDANAPPNWAEVVSIRLNLLFRSLEENVTTTPQRVLFPASDTGLANRVGTVFSAADGDRGRYLPVFSTVTIRNRLP